MNQIKPLFIHCMPLRPEQKQAIESAGYVCVHNPQNLKFEIAQGQAVDNSIITEAALATINGHFSSSYTSEEVKRRFAENVNSIFLSKLHKEELAPIPNEEISPALAYTPPITPQSPVVPVQKEPSSV